MNLPCELIQDLFPLYYDGICSEASKRIVQAHLNICDACAATLNALDGEIEVPKLDTDEAKPLKAIKRKSLKKSILIGLTVFVIVLWSVLYLTVFSSVEIKSSDFTIRSMFALSDGRIYVEYSHPYIFSGNSVDVTGTADGAEYWQYHRPILVFQAEEDERVMQRRIIDPEMNRVWYGYDDSTLVTSFYLGRPGQEDALLVWSEDMEIPAMAPEMEKLYQYLYPYLF